MKKEINFDDWQKLDLRVGKIVEVEDIEGADKLYKFTVDFGSEIGERIICSGLKELYSKEDLKGKKYVFVVNLEARKLRGVESHGMILAAGNDETNEWTMLQTEKDVEEGMGVS